MASPGSSQGLRNGAIVLCAILVAGGVSLCPLATTDDLLAWLNVRSGDVRQLWNEVLVPGLFVALAVTGLATLPGLPRFHSAVLSSIFAATLIAVAITRIHELESRAAEARRLREVAVRMAAEDFVRAGVTDRKPDRKWVSLVEALAPPVRKLPPQESMVRNSTVRTLQVLGPIAPLPAVVRLGAFDNAKETPVTSDLVYFARGYNALRRGDFPGAKGAFAEASSLYDFSNESMRYMLAYYAFAAANTGDASAVERLLDSINNSEYQRFDYHLAKAVLAGLGGKHDDAARALQLALHWRPLMDGRPLHSEHQYAEIVEWLFEATRKPGYRDAMLAWARAHQEFAPELAWPHAIIAKHSRDARERRSAAAMAYYLDPKSERLSTVSQTEIDAAAREFSRASPHLGAERPG